MSEVTRRMAQFFLVSKIMGRELTVDDIVMKTAEVSYQVHGLPDDDTIIIDAARGLAEGLLGPVFNRICDCERWHWIDRCEDALRTAANRPKGV